MNLSLKRKYTVNAAPGQDLSERRQCSGLIFARSVVEGRPWELTNFRFFSHPLTLYTSFQKWNVRAVFSGCYTCRSLGLPASWLIKRSIKIQPPLYSAGSPVPPRPVSLVLPNNLIPFQWLLNFLLSMWLSHTFPLIQHLLFILS